MATTHTLELVRQHIARGMSEEALRRAMGIRPRDWPGTKVMLAGAAVETPPPANVETDRTWTATQGADEPRETAGQRKRRETLEREQQREAARLARQAQRDLKRQQRHEETLRRQAERRQREEARKAAHLKTLAEREQRLREEQDRRDKGRDEVFAKGKSLAAMVRRVAADVPRAPTRPLATATVDRYAAWLIRAHVPQITAGEIAVLLGWSESRRALLAIDLVHVQLQTPTFRPALAALHQRVRAEMEKEGACASCAALTNATGAGSK